MEKSATHSRITEKIPRQPRAAICPPFLQKERRAKQARALGQHLFALVNTLIGFPHHLS
jgi:hypothetical protein